jgi:multisubunit Na+/H+ antiporter MnhG subunit
MSRRHLQIAMVVLGAVPVLTGLIGLTGLDDPLYARLHLTPDATLDSNLRFYSGVWLGLGLAAWWLVPRIERETSLYRALWLMIFLGGVGRLLSLASAGLPMLPFVGFTALEIAGAPLLIWWHARLVRR